MQMKKNKQATPIAKPMMQTVALIVILIVASLAWFVFGDYSELSPLELTAQEATNVWISNTSDSDNWDKNLVVNGNFDGNAATVTEYSGNGTELYLPITANKEVIGYFPLSDGMDQNYLEYTAYIKSDGPTEIFLGDESSVTPLDLSTNISSDGDYSMNYIVGAVRVAIFTEENKDAPIVWAPNSRIEYLPMSNSILSTGVVEDTYTYATGTDITDIKTIPTNGRTSGIDSEGTFIWGDISNIGNKSAMKPILVFGNSYGEENIKELKIRVWVEGSDREAIRSLSGGKFRLNLKFASSNSEG